jgi:uncharacterized protein YbjT (DUF2867 family)
VQRRGEAAPHIIKEVLMTILVTGSTGTIGSQIVARLAKEGATVHALTRSPDKTSLPAGVTAVKGDLIDVDSMRAALKDVTTLFLLVANVPDELTQAVITLALAREAGIERIVYLSVFKGEAYTDVPHFTGKFAVERMIEQFDMAATVLRPAYYMQNDIRQKTALTGPGLYAMPIGQKGISMVDTRDIADVAASELLRRERAATALPRETIELVGPDALDGPAIAALWSDVLQRPIRYGGDDLAPLEQALKAVAPSWTAYDMRLMMHRYQTDGAVASKADLDKLTAVLGRAPRSYRDFAIETAKQWQES